jgi:predicted dehydrogenase
MKTVAIIGLGRISEHYLNGLQSSNKLKVIAVCDQDASKNDRKLFGKIPFFVVN